jgi:hypothetical protein
MTFVGHAKSTIVSKQLTPRLDGVQVIIKHTRISHLKGWDCNDSSHSDNGGQLEVQSGARQQQGGGRQQLGSLQSLP